MTSIILHVHIGSPSRILKDGHELGPSARLALTRPCMRPHSTILVNKEKLRRPSTFHLGDGAFVRAEASRGGHNSVAC